MYIFTYLRNAGAYFNEICTITHYYQAHTTIKVMAGSCVQRSTFPGGCVVIACRSTVRSRRPSLGLVYAKLVLMRDVMTSDPLSFGWNSKGQYKSTEKQHIGTLT